MESNNKYSANKSAPFILVHPGEIIKEELEARGISQRQIANQIGFSYSQFNEVLNGKRALTSELALLLEASLDIEAQPLMKLQLDYNLQQTKSNPTFLKRLASLRRVAAIL